MTQGNSKSSKILFLVVAAGAAATLLLVLRSMHEEPAPRVEKPPVVAQKAPEPVAPPTPEPHVVREPEEERVQLTPMSDTPAVKVRQNPDEVRATLLGANKKKTVVENVERERPVSKKNGKKRATREQPVDDGEWTDNMQESGSGSGMSDATFYATMERWRGVKSCLATGTTRNEEIKGEPNGALRISLKISDAGEVLDSRVFDPSNDVAKMIAPCVERSAKQIKFPAFADGSSAQSVTKIAKFVF